MAVNTYINHGADAVIIRAVDTKLRHQFAVADGNPPAVNHSGDTVTADFLNVTNTAAVNGSAQRREQTFADWVAGSAVGIGGIFQQRFGRYIHGVDGSDLKHAFCQSAGLVKDNGIHLSQGFNIVGALYQHTCLAGTADAGKEGQGDTDYQRTGTAGHKET